MNNKKINCYVANLIHRKDRKAHIIREFQNKKLFKIEFVSPVYDSIGAVSLWKTICHTIRKEILINSDFFIFCEDDHCFTASFTDGYLLTQILAAQEHEADLLAGGVS